jgi:hypothetical protein
MKQSSLLTTIFLLFAFSSGLYAQEEKGKEKKKKQQPENAFKVNLTGIALKNYSFQYERVLNRKISFALAFRTMPETGVPFKNTILDLTDNDPDAKDVLDNLQLSNTAITPEIRFYLSKKGYGRGFYIAPFYRYASFKASNVKFSYTNTLNTESDILLAGKVTANTGGLLFGSQWAIGKYFCLDLWILGPHYGSGKGSFTGTTSTPMTPAEQNDLRQELEDFDIPLTDKTVTVTANGATVKLDGPWGGLRSGLSFGFRF